MRDALFLAKKPRIFGLFEEKSRRSLLCYVINCFNYVVFLFEICIKLFLFAL